MMRKDHYYYGLLFKLTALATIPAHSVMIKRAYRAPLAKFSFYVLQSGAVFELCTAVRSFYNMKKF